MADRQNFCSKLRKKLRKSSRKIPQRRTNETSAPPAEEPCTTVDKNIKVVRGGDASKQFFILKPGEYVDFHKIACPENMQGLADKEFVLAFKVKDSEKEIPNVTIIQAKIDISTKTPEVMEIIFYQDPCGPLLCDAAVNTEYAWIPLPPQDHNHTSLVTTEGATAESVTPCISGPPSPCGEMICHTVPQELPCDDQHIHHVYPTDNLPCPQPSGWAFMCENNHTHYPPPNYVCDEGHEHPDIEPDFEFRCIKGHMHMGYEADIGPRTFQCEEGHIHDRISFYSEHENLSFCERYHVHDSEGRCLGKLKSGHPSLEQFICDHDHLHDENVISISPSEQERISVQSFICEQHHIHDQEGLVISQLQPGQPSLETYVCDQSHVHDESKLTAGQFGEGESLIHPEFETEQLKEEKEMAFICENQHIHSTLPSAQESLQELPARRSHVDLTVTTENISPEIAPETIHIEGVDISAFGDTSVAYTHKKDTSVPECDSCNLPPGARCLGVVAVLPHPMDKYPTVSVSYPETEHPAPCPTISPTLEQATYYSFNDTKIPALHTDTSYLQICTPKQTIDSEPPCSSVSPCPASSSPSQIIPNVPRFESRNMIQSVGSPLSPQVSPSHMLTPASYPTVNPSNLTIVAPPDVQVRPSSQAIKTALCLRTTAPYAEMNVTCPSTEMAPTMSGTHTPERPLTITCLQPSYTTLPPVSSLPVEGALCSPSSNQFPPMSTLGTGQQRSYWTSDQPCRRDSEQHPATAPAFLPTETPCPALSIPGEPVQHTRSKESTTYTYEVTGQEPTRISTTKEIQKHSDVYTAPCAQEMNPPSMMGRKMAIPQVPSFGKPQNSYKFVAVSQDAPKLPRPQHHYAPQVGGQIFSVLPTIPEQEPLQSPANYYTTYKYSS